MADQELTAEQVALLELVCEGSGGLLATPFTGDLGFRVIAATLNRLGLNLNPMLPTRFINDPYMRVIPTDAGRAKVTEIKAARAAKETP